MERSKIIDFLECKKNDERTGRTTPVSVKTFLKHSDLTIKQVEDKAWGKYEKIKGKEQTTYNDRFITACEYWSDNDYLAVYELYLSEKIFEVEVE